MSFIDPKGLIWVYQDFQEGKKTLRRFAWVDGKKAPNGWKAYTGPNVVNLIDGRTIRLNKVGTYNVIGAPAPKVIETNAGLRNAAIGGFHGSVPFGKTITDTLGVHADEDSAEYQAGDKAGFAISTALSVASLGAGTARAAGSVADDGTTTLYRAVSNAEFEQIMRTGTFEAGPNSVVGKYFAETAEHAEQWGWHCIRRARVLLRSSMPRFRQSRQINL